MLTTASVYAQTGDPTAEELCTDFVNSSTAGYTFKQGGASEFLVLAGLHHLYTNKYSDKATVAALTEMSKGSVRSIMAFPDNMTQDEVYDRMNSSKPICLAHIDRMIREFGG